MAQDLYEVLGVPRTANTEEIKKAFRARAMQYHPDRNPGDAEAARQYAQVNAAKEVLLDPTKRAVYDNKPRGVSGLSALLARPLGTASLLAAIPTAPKARRNGVDRLIVLDDVPEAACRVCVSDDPLREPIDLPGGLSAPACGVVPLQGAPGENGGNAGTLFILFVGDL